MKIDKKETQEYKNRMNLIKEIIIIFLVIIFIGMSSFEIYLDMNNLKFISNIERQALLDVLDLGEYTNSVEVLSYKVLKNEHGSYKVLEFKISKEEYEKNSLKYTDETVSMNSESIKEVENDYYECKITINKSSNLYNYDQFIANSKANNIIRYVIAIILIMMFIVIIKLIRQVMYYTCNK